MPTAPDYMNPVDVPPVTPGIDARVALAHHRAALAQANQRLTDSRAWYGALQKRYAK